MECSATYIAPVHVIKLSGSWNSSSAPAFEEYCEELEQREKLRFVVLDLHDVQYVSSFGLRALLNLAKKLERFQGGVHVVGLSPEVHKVFEGCGFLSLFPEFSDAGDARQAFLNRNGQPGN